MSRIDLINLINTFYRVSPNLNRQVHSLWANKTYEPPTLAGPPWLYQGSGPPCCTTPRQPTIHVPTGCLLYFYLNKNVRGKNVSFCGCDVKKSSSGRVVNLLTNGLIERQQLEHGQMQLNLLHLLTFWIFVNDKNKKYSFKFVIWKAQVGLKGK